MTASASSLPFLDLAAPGFSTRSAEVLAARSESWCARTPWGLAVLRRRQAGRLLRDRRLRQGSHAWPQTVGISGVFAEFWRRSVISQEGERHRLLRRVAQAALAEEFVLSLNPRFAEAAEELSEGLAGGGAFDFVTRFSEPFAGHAIVALLGLPAGEAAPVARDAATLGLAMGPDARDHEAAVNGACRRLLARAGALLDDPASDSYVARLVAEAGAAGLRDRQALVDMVVISIFGGVDTTRAQLAFAALLFARHPDQWSWLRAHPEAVPQAIEEVIRTRPTTTWATREALEDFELDGVSVRAGETLHILVHATATDPLDCDWKGFDVRVRRPLHFGFGGGAHHCLGQFVARTDMAAALGVLLRRWRALRLAEPPEFLPDSGNTSPRRLMIEAEAG